jgi:hypothetical protein
MRLGYDLPRGLQFELDVTYCLEKERQVFDE